MPPSDLRSLQEWFQAAVVRPSLPRGRRGAPTQPAARHVLPASALTAQERVAIYAGMHYARLHDCLAEDYPALRVVAGEAGFDAIVRGFLADHPPRSFTLSALGRALPEWIAARRSLPRRALLFDVARVERAMSVVFDAPRERALTPADLAALPPEAWTDPRPRLIGALELLALDHSASAIVRAARHGEPLPALARARTFTVVWRQDEVVSRVDLDPALFAVLAALRAGEPLAQALRAAERVHAGPAADLEARVSRAFREWAADGYFGAPAWTAAASSSSPTTA